MYMWCKCGRKYLWDRTKPAIDEKICPDCNAKKHKKKYCSTCKQLYHINDFNLCHRSPDGLYSQCKRCKSESTRRQKAKWQPSVQSLMDCASASAWLLTHKKWDLNAIENSMKKGKKHEHTTSN